MGSVRDGLLCSTVVEHGNVVKVGLLWVCWTGLVNAVDVKKAKQEELQVVMMKMNV